MPAVPSSSSTEGHESAGSAMLKERRFKLSRACDRCRRRRIKCDEGFPCQACITATSACTFEEPGKRSNPSKSKRATTLEDRMHHLETLIQAIPPAVFAAGPAAAAGFPPMSPEASYPSGSFNSLPDGIPPPSLHGFPLTNPSTHFTQHSTRQESPGASFYSLFGDNQDEHLSEETSRMSISDSYLYFDDEGYTRWQGETSGFPLLDLLVDRHTPPENREDAPTSNSNSWTTASPNGNSNNPDWFPDRKPRRADVSPETLWRMITSFIPPDLMDSLVQCFLSTSYYILPFLHVPTFLSDYGNPQKWGEPGFSAFIVAICCLASRHIDDPRVRTDPNDGISAGTRWFELFGRLRTLPIADRPTLYTIQANLIGGVYAVGLGKLSKAAALLAEAITVSVDAGLHRSADTYDIFDAIEDEVRKRTFWCVYIWDKQLCAHFGRPPMIRLRDCDIGEPVSVDDEYITHEGVGVPPAGAESRMSAFVIAIRILVVLESVIDVPPTRSVAHVPSFLARATAVLSGTRRRKEMREEEALLDDIHRSIPLNWVYSPEALRSEDTIRITQATRLHCAEHFVRLLIYRHRFSELFAERTAGSKASEEQEPGEVEKEAMTAAQNSALQIVAAHLHVATKGLMTYYGVHVIHQLTQAGRTLVALLLNCKSESLQHLIPPALDALRSCVGLLRKFSGRYVCGLRSGDLMEEFCRLTQIPLGPTPQPENSSSNGRVPWLRPVRKKVPSTSTTRSTESPPNILDGSPDSTLPTPEFLADLSKNPGSNDLDNKIRSRSLGRRRPSTSGSSSRSPILANHSVLQHGPSHLGPTSPQYASPPSSFEPSHQLDPQIYMSHSDMLAMFSGTDVSFASLNSNEQELDEISLGLGGNGEAAQFDNFSGMKMNDIIELASEP